MADATTTTGEANANGKRPRSISPLSEKYRKTSKLSSTSSTHFSYQDLPPKWSRNYGKTSSNHNKDSDPSSLTLKYHTGNLFSAGRNTVLVHACNTQGSWGAGIAKAFKEQYPEAYTIYHNFCVKQHNPKINSVPTGTALLISPVDEGDQKHWIGCLFTSAKYGRAKDKAEVIVQNTGSAMAMLLELVKNAEDIDSVRMCKINSGKFGVAWERTEKMLQSIDVAEGWFSNVEIWEPKET